MIGGMKTRLELMDEIYSLGYWMTGSQKAANDLLTSTYLGTNIASSEPELIRIFRNRYFKSIGKQDTEGDFTDTLDQSKESLARSLWTWAEDIKLTVLLSEISKLKYCDISEITGKSLETIRLWLAWGRKQVGNGSLMNYTLMSKAKKVLNTTLTQPALTLIRD
jgi:hypothetical protein